MFTRLSRLHPNIQILVVAIGGILLWSSGFMNMPLPLKGSELSPLYEWAFGWTFNSGLLSTIIAFVLMSATAILLHVIVVDAGLLPRNNFIPPLITMLVLTYSPDMLRLSPILPANLLLVLSLGMMIRMRLQTQSYQDIFSAGLFLALATLFNPYHAFFIPLIWFALILFRTGSFREWIISILGILTPFGYTLFIVFWNDQVMETTEIYRNFFQTFRFFKGLEVQPMLTYVIPGLMTILILPAFFRFTGRLNEKLIALRKSSMLLVWIFLLGLLSLAALQSDWFLNGSVLLLAASVIISSYLISVKKKRVPEILLALLTAAVIAGRFIL